MGYTEELYLQKLKEVNPDIKVLGHYTRAVDRIRVQCLSCGRVWEPKAYSLLQGRGCKICSTRRGAINNKGKTGLKTTQQFIDDLKRVDSSIHILSEYQNSHTKIKCRCSRCCNEWEAMPYSLLQGHGCPRCAKSGTSFMEQFILLSFQKALGNNNVLSRDKKAIGMELDIYIPCMNLAIEPGNWWLHRRFIRRDIKKRELCHKRGIRLITIYDKYPESQALPFKEDIYTFLEDLNIADHSIIRDLVMNLFHEAKIDNRFTDEVWNQIETNAYDRAKSLTHEQFVSKMLLIHPGIKVIGYYQNANRRLKVKCTVCGYEWNAIPANLLSGDGCKKCGTRKAHEGMVKSQEDFEKEISAVNPEVEIIGEYKGRHSKVRTKCKICGFEWSPTASSLLRGSNHKGSKSIHKKLNKQMKI